MPISILNLNEAPYYDDYDIEKQYHRILFKPRFAVQARELTQLQTILQNQIEQFGDNIFQEGSIVKGCNFTELNDLEYVKVKDRAGFDVFQYIGADDGTTEISYELVGQVTGLRASVIATARGFETNDPNLNTFFIKYLNKNNAQENTFQAGELLHINRVTSVNDVIVSPESGDTPAETINVTSRSNHVGKSFGLSISDGIIFQKGHFLFAEEQLVIISKYTDTPDNVSVGYRVEERVISALQDSTLYDNALGSPNENAPGADRLKLVPVLVTMPTTQAEQDPTFFILSRYVAGNAVQVRDVSQYNVIGQELAKRTYEESGDYILQDFKVKAVRRESANNAIQAAVGPGVAYVKGFRVENRGEIYVDIDPVLATDVQVNQPISFNYGGYVDITTIAGTVPFGTFGTVSLRNSSNTAIGTAIVKNITPDKLYLFNARMTGSNKFSSVTAIRGAAGAITIPSNSSIKNPTNDISVFDTGMFSLFDTENTTIPVRSFKALTGLTSNTVVITADVNEDFAGITNNDIVFVDSTNTRINVTSTTVSANSSILTVELAATPAANASIYFNKRIVLTEPYSKLEKTVFAKVDFSTLTAKYNLGFPDVFEIVSITDSANTDVTNSFRLNTNQRDNYYDHSFIEYISGRTLPANGELVVQMKVFQLNTTTGQYFFTINSYPNGLDASKIPVYTSTSGKKYNLRDCFDFRPYVDLRPNASYSATTAAAALVVSDASTGVDLEPAFAGSILVPALNNAGQTDIEYYLNRTDLLTIDSYGKFAIIKGEEKQRSVAPKSDNRLVISEIFVPGNPILSPEEAAIAGKPQYGIKIKPLGIKNYTMSDIQKIEKNVELLRYYVLLSSLESSTQNLNITDENGLTRFKNGIVVDPFNDLSIADISNPEFNSAVDFTEKSLMPSVKTFPLNMKLQSSSGVSLYPSANAPEVATLARNAAPIPIISQTYATNFRNCVSNFYNYKGEGSIFPEYDMAYDMVTNPVEISIDVAGAFEQFADTLQEFYPLTSTDSRVVGSSTTTTRSGRTTTTTTNTRIQDTIRELEVGAARVTQGVGDFVSNFDFNPFMRSRQISIFMTGLRPNTRHYVFFDKEDVNEFVAPGTPTALESRNIFRFGNFGDPIISDDDGVIRAVFFIPASRFFVGDRNLEIYDVDTYSNAESASTSNGFLTYRAYNFSVEKSSLTLSTRMPETRVIESTTTRNVVSRTTRTRRRRESSPTIDPIAQTFFIKQGMGEDSDSVFVSKIDLYFKRKSTTNGVTIMLREVLNGYPAFEILPFSKIHLTKDQVNISDDGTIPTVITFTAPVRLDTEKEYCVVIMPDANDPDYLIYTSKVGGTNLADNTPVVQDWGDGVLFTSTNNRAWKSEQDEDLKFTLYREDFALSDGTVFLTNEDHEFLTNTDNTGRFNVGEIVYTEKALQGSTANTVSVTTGSNIITGTSLSESFVAGDYMIIDNGVDKNLLRVVSSTTTTVIADRPVSFTDTADVKPVVIGTLINYDFRRPEKMILENSSAAERLTGDRVFAAGNTIYGYDSAATATIVSVDNENMSYIQPMLLRTNDSVTATYLNGQFTDPSDVDSSYTQNLNFNDKTVFNNKGAVIYSKSNDLNREKPFILSVRMTNTGNRTSSPFFDVETAMIFAYQYQITNTPSTTSKYISKPVEFVEGLDAEDFQIYLTAYRPLGSDVKVYIKPQNQSDPILFENNAWIELELTEGISLFSSPSNLNDFREYVYKVSDTNKTAGVLSYSNSAGAFEGYRKFAIRIDLLSENIFNVPRLLDYRGIALT